ncbi:MAG: hypothetical protein ACTSQ4_09925 [Candidatus Heimdallarchaeaceae archaeon]
MLKILITSKNGELLYQYDSFSENKIHDNALVTGLISAIVALSSEVVNSFPREIEFEGKILYFYTENELIVALLVDIEAPFNGDILPILLAEFKKVQQQYNFSIYQAIKYEAEVSTEIKSALAGYLSNMQKNMLNILDKTDLSDYESMVKLKNVARDVMFDGSKDFLSFEIISRLVPEGLDKVLYGLIVGIPVVVVGNRNLVETMIHSLRLLSPTRILNVKPWSFRYERGYDIIGTNDFQELMPSNTLIITNIDEGIVFGGRSSAYFEELIKQISNLNAVEAFTLLRTELDWIFQSMETLSIRSHSKDNLPLEKQMILFELLKRLH